MRYNKIIRKDNEWKRFLGKKIKHTIVVGGDPDWMLKALGWKKNDSGKR